MSAIGPTIPPFVASAQRLAELRQERAARRIAKSLFDGKWREALLASDVSNHFFHQVNAGEASKSQSKTLITGVGMLKIAYRTHADILALRPVRISTPDGHELQDAAIDQIRRHGLFDMLYHEIVLTCYAERQAAVQPEIVNGSVAIVLRDNEETFAVGEPGPDGQPTVWERRWIVERPDPADPRKVNLYLRVERHRAPGGVGVVEQEAWATESSDVLQSTAGLKAASLDRVLGPGHGVEPIVATGLAYPLIVQFVTYRRKGRAQCTLDDASIGLIDAMVAGFTRIERTMEIHAQAKTRVPEGWIRDGKVNLSLDAFVDPDRLFEYVQTHFKFEEMTRFFSVVMQWLILSVGMSSSLLGFKPDGGAAPDSTDKLRLEATPTIAQAQRVSIIHAAALSRVFDLASLLAARLPLQGWAVGPTSVRVRADLPGDQPGASAGNAEDAEDAETGADAQTGAEA